MTIWDAVNEGNPQEVINYLNGGGAVDPRDDRNRTPLLLLLELEHGDELAARIAQPFIQKKADVNVSDSEGNPAVILAIKKHYSELAKLLIDAGADVKAKDKDDKTSLHWCTQEQSWCDQEESRYVIAALLLEKGADVNAQDNIGNTPLHFLYDSEDKIYKLLLRKGADETILNNDRDLPGRGPYIDLEKL